jgi:ankyrin repeat protein
MNANRVVHDTFVTNIVSKAPPVLLQEKAALAVAVVDAIRSGDLPTLTRLLDGHEALATARIVKGPCLTSRTLLHIATDWPGHFPNVAKTIALLIHRGADVNAQFGGGHAETPLHWAASSDDVDAIEALLKGGADIEASGGVIADGTPLADARGFGQWNAARHLLNHGARTTLIDEATLGLLERLTVRFEDPTTSPNHDQITHAFWAACHGGQLDIAAFLFAHGADINWRGRGDMTPLDIVQQPSAEALAGKPRVQMLIDWLIAHGATSSSTRG